jgi:hypothetical protein
MSSTIGLGIALVFVIGVILFALFIWPVPQILEGIDVWWRDPPIVVSVFGVSPNPLQMGQTGELTVKIDSRRNDPLNITLYLETSPNVIITLPRKTLPRVGLNFTCEGNMLPAKGSTTLSFNVTATLDAGVQTIGYYVKGYFVMTDPKIPEPKKVTFTVNR